jgi:ubiquinone/menaquinone biosynthesis C-methylase UbiE
MGDRPAFDYEDVFDEDYLYFYETILSEERTARDVETISTLISLEPGMRVLDLACGHGRIANRLAERGASVVGLDATPLFLDRARKDAAERGVTVEYVSGDMRSLPYSGEFDAVVNWFTAFGYFPDDENRAVLREVCRSLKPGGRFVIDHLNRDRVLRNMQPSVIHERDGNLLIDRHTYLVETGFMESERIVVKDGAQRRFRFSARTFTPPELRDWLLQAGFSSAEPFDENAQPNTLDSMRLVMRATK